MFSIPWNSEERQNYIRVEYIVADAVRNEHRIFFIREGSKRYQASFEAWDDTNSSGSLLFNLEKKRSRPNYNKLQSKFCQRDTNQRESDFLNQFFTPIQR